MIRSKASQPVNQSPTDPKSPWPQRKSKSLHKSKQREREIKKGRGLGDFVNKSKSKIDSKKAEYTSGSWKRKSQKLNERLKKWKGGNVQFWEAMLKTQMRKISSLSGLERSEINAGNWDEIDSENRTKSILSSRLRSADLIEKLRYGPRERKWGTRWLPELTNRSDENILLE